MLGQVKTTASTSRTTAQTARSLQTARERAFYGYLALAFLALTAAVSIYWSHWKLMDNDEYLSYYGDSAPTVRDVVSIQLHYPISLDPPAYHVLSHLCMGVFGRNEMAMRVPALLGFLLFQGGLFVFVRRMAGSRAAIVALLLPLVGTTYFYSVVGRPYALLLGLYAVSLACWQTARRRYAAGRPRWLALIGVAAALALAITSHYFGVLILLPICLAEMTRCIRRREVDYAMLAAILAGAAGIAIILPFRRALMVYREHYYISRVDLGVIREAYRTIFFRYFEWGALARGVLSAVLVAGLLVLAAAAWRRYRRRGGGEPAQEWVALAAIAALPIFGYLFAQLVTHTIEVRYVIAWQFAAMACAAICMEKLLRNRFIFYGVVVGILAVAWVVQGRQIEIYRADRTAKLASMEVPPEFLQTLLSDPHQRIYVQSLENFFTDEHYEPDPRIRERLSYVYGSSEEVRWLGHDTNAITARNLTHFTRLSVVSYPQFLADPAPLLLVYRLGWEWIEQDLQARDRRTVYLGPLLRGGLLGVQPPLPAELGAASNH
jgi:hypothetical protein